jgi:hypothetical protein
MAQICIDFLLGPDLSSRFIAWYGTGSNGYSHCASILSDGRYLDARSDVLGGVPAGVHIRVPTTEKWIKKRHATLDVTQAEYDSWEASLRAKISDDYGKTDIWSFILGKDQHEGGHWICSALVINAIQHIKRIPYPLPVPAHQITPDAALLIVATAGFTIGPEQKAP